MSKSYSIHKFTNTKLTWNKILINTSRAFHLRGRCELYFRELRHFEYFVLHFALFLLLYHRVLLSQTLTHSTSSLGHWKSTSCSDVRINQSCLYYLQALRTRIQYIYTYNTYYSLAIKCACSINRAIAQLIEWIQHAYTNWNYWRAVRLIARLQYIHICIHT